jgi:type III pantothenate kinase
MQVVIDVGNTRIKWALLDDHGRLTDNGGALHRGALDDALATLAAALPPATRRVIVANVAGDRVAERLAHAVRASVGIDAEFVATAKRQFGVECAYADPSRLGVDRWVAVLAAHVRAQRAACVIDAGTAVTFDVVDGGGRHLGGLILAGPRLSAAALERNTSDIGATAAVGAAPQGLAVLGTTTDAAVANGAMLAVAAALDRAVGTVRAKLGGGAAVYLTGGDAETLQGWLETQVELRADLVLEGLALFAATPPIQRR